MVKRPNQSMWQQLIKLSKDSEEGLQLQLRKNLTHLILEQRISPDIPLPSSRYLAVMLEVSRSTVTLAYQRLVDEEYLVSRERQGYFVNPDLIQSIPQTKTQRAISSQRQDWDTRLKFRVSGQKNIHKPVDWYNYPFPFIFGQIGSDLVPLSEWRECWRHAQSARSITRGGYDLFDQDDASLVEQLRKRVLPKRGLWCHSDNILVTLGAQNALALIAKLLIKQDNIVGMENPGYPDARNLFELETDNIRLLDVDAEGLVVDERLYECDYVYTTPAFQSPTTATMSPARRMQLLDAAKQHNIVVIEDDYETEAAFGDEPIPSLKSQDENNTVIYCGSLSKSLAPGLRVGFLIADTALIDEARALRRLTIRHPPPLIESTVALFIELGHYDSHLNRLSRTYRQRWATMNEAINQHFPFVADFPTKPRKSFGGSAFWIEGPPSLDAGRLSNSALTKGILIESGAVHFGECAPPQNFFRLGFSAIANEKITPGIAKLATLIRRG